MQIVEINGLHAHCEVKGVRREVSLHLVQGEVEIGDFVMVHVGYAIQKMSKSEAQSAWELQDEWLSSQSRSA